jgi:Ca-activated chloride channel homolog
MNKNYLLLYCLILFLIAISAFTSFPVNSFQMHTSADTLLPKTIKAKDHLGKNVVATGGVISFTTGLENDYYQVDSIDKMGHFYVEVKIAKFLNDNAKRIPLNISIVIDRSGSMQGVKMGFAKKAAKNIIDQLKSEDVVSIVVYDSGVDTLQPPVHVIEKEKIKSKIDMITAQASTNLWGGTDQGYQFVQRTFNPGYVNRVLLISDGLANVGLTDSTLIRIKVQKFKDDDGISLSTFGVGLDYNESLMTVMAETGAGNYYFIDTPDKMTGIFNNELNGLLNVAAQNAILKVKVPRGVTILKSYPLKYEHAGDEIMVKLRDLSSEETKATLFTFKIDDTVREVLKFKSAIVYTDATDGQQKSLTNENFLSPIKTVDGYLTHFNKKVIEQTILFTANETLETAMNMIDRGDYNSARRYMDQNSNYLKSNEVYIMGNTEGFLKRMDSLNTNYFTSSQSFRSANLDSVKILKKSLRSSNYQLRNKKQ